MKLLFISACGSREGDINHALLVLKHLPAEVEIVVATIPRGPVADDLRALPGTCMVEEVEMGGSELPSQRRAKGTAAEAQEFLSALRRIVGLARRERVDLVCAIDRTVATYLAAFVARAIQRPFVLIAAYPFYGLHGPLNRLALRSAARLISHSQYLTTHLKRFVKHPDRIVTIPDPLDVDLYVPNRPEIAALRASWNLPPEASVVLLAGRVSKYKGHDDLIRAAAIIVKRYPATRFLISGRADPERMTIDGIVGTFEEHLKRLIRASGLEQHVLLLGYVPDLTVAMGAADIVTMPSKEEPYGLVALEGMAMAKPVVATRAGGVPEFIIDGETGLLTRPGDPEALAMAVLQLLDDPVTAKAMGLKAREHIMARFTIGTYIEKLMPVLRTLTTPSTDSTTAPPRSNVRST